jgi:hypothetical protein
VGLRRAFAAFVSLGAVAATSGDTLPLREAHWIAPEARFNQLTHYVPPCAGQATANPLYGAIAFHDPLLLGGQAARAGISCASCHRGARGNPGFQFRGLSDGPGTADVSTSFFSMHRGDGVPNPVPIPDLTFDKPKVSHTEPGKLEAFIRGLIVEEFDGAEPPPRVIASLAAFVRSLDSKRCEPDERLKVEHDLSVFAMAIGASRAAMFENDRDTAIVMLRAARSRLGLIAERYRDDAQAQDMLSTASAALATHQDELRAGQPLEPIATAVDARWGKIGLWAEPLLQRSAASLYNPDRLAAALNAAQTP